MTVVTLKYNDPITQMLEHIMEIHSLTGNHNSAVTNTVNTILLITLTIVTPTATYLKTRHEKNAIRRCNKPAWYKVTIAEI